MTTSFNINYQNISIDPTAQPRLSSSTQKFIAQISHLTPETVWQASKGAADMAVCKMKELTAATAQLKDAQDHSTRDKLIGILKTALVLSLIAATVFGTIATFALPAHGALPMVPLMVGTISTALVTLLLANEFWEEFSSKRPASDACLFVLALPFLGAFLPAIGAFNRISHRQKCQDNLIQETTTRFEQIQAALPQVIEYFSKNYAKLRVQLEEEIQQMNISLKKQSRTLSPTSSELLEIERNGLVTANDELAALHGFYHRSINSNDSANGLAPHPADLSPRLRA